MSTIDRVFIRPIKRIFGDFSDDLKSEALAVPTWDAQNPPGSLDTLFRDFVFVPATKAADWYFVRRAPKRAAGLFLRFIALGLAGAGIAIPLVSQLLERANNVPVLQAGWATLALMAATGLVWVDRLLGATSGWMRYVTSGLELTALRDKAVLQWVELQRTWPATLTAAEEVAATTLLRGLNGEIREIVRKETTEWIAEFRSSLDQIDVVLKTRLQESQKLLDEMRTAATAPKPEPPKPGALNVTISNPDCKECKIEITDGFKPDSVDGRSHGFLNLTAGQWRVKGIGKLVDAAGASHNASQSKVVILKPGEAIEVALTLAVDG